VWLLVHLLPFSFSKETARKTKTDGRIISGWGDVDWIGLVFGIEPSGSMKCWETAEWPLE
jgi:hypothetical protein